MNVIAVDVGTTSVRLALISFRGDLAREANILASHKKDIIYTQNGTKFEQSSSEIWAAICECCKICLKRSNIDPQTIRAIAFSATCSLVVENSEEKCTDNIIMWMDHRATNQAHRVTNSESKVLEQFGGVCSPEFSLSKLLWLKEQDPPRFQSATGFFELPDWLVYRCMSVEPQTCTRSLCSVVCKWGYDPVSNSHCDIIKSLDPAILDKIGETVSNPGMIAGYMSERSAEELGLLAEHEKENLKPLKIVVGTSLIDAHAGMLAMLSTSLDCYNIDCKTEAKFCSLAGTSSCHMLLSKQRNFTHGIWGPYMNVIIEGYNLLEAGQSLTGKLIEICIETHVEGKRRLQGGESMHTIIESLNHESLKGDYEGELHLLPTFHGNRSPLANPRLRGGVYGLSVEGEKSLLEYYIATVQSLTYELKSIVETLGTKLDAILVSGGLMKNAYYMQTLADVLQCKVVKMNLRDVDFMVMGSGLVARHAALSMLDSKEKDGPLRESDIENIQYNQLEVELFNPNSERETHHMKRYNCYKEFVTFSQRVDRILNVD